MRRLVKRIALGLAAVALTIMSLQVFGLEDPVPKDIQVKKNPVPLSDPIIAKARQTFANNCVQCHGTAGKGDGPMAGMLKETPADLTSNQLLGKLTDGEIFWLIAKGKGSVMPSFEPKLKEEERWGLVHILRDLSNTKSNNTPQAGR